MTDCSTVSLCIVIIFLFYRSDDNVDGGVTVIIVFGVLLTIFAAVLLVFLYKIRHYVPGIYYIHIYLL